MPKRFLKFIVMFAVHFLILVALISRSAANEDGLVIKIGKEIHFKNKRSFQNIINIILYIICTLQIN